MKNTSRVSVGPPKSRCKFTVEQGKAIQRDQLAAWKVVLKDGVYDALIKAVEEEERKSPPRDGYDVLRGWRLEMIIFNPQKRSTITDMQGHELAAIAVLSAVALCGTMHLIAHVARKVREKLTNKANKRHEPKL